MIQKSMEIMDKLKKLNYILYTERVEETIGEHGSATLTFPADTTVRVDGVAYNNLAEIFICEDIAEFMINTADTSFLTVCTYDMNLGVFIIDESIINDTVELVITFNRYNTAILESNYAEVANYPRIDMSMTSSIRMDKEGFHKIFIAEYSLLTSIFETKGHVIQTLMANSLEHLIIDIAPRTKILNDKINIMLNIMDNKPQFILSGDIFLKITGIGDGCFNVESVPVYDYEKPMSGTISFDKLDSISYCVIYDNDMVVVDNGVYVNGERKFSSNTLIPLVKINSEFNESLLYRYLEVAASVKTADDSITSVDSINSVDSEQFIKAASDIFDTAKDLISKIKLVFRNIPNLDIDDVETNVVKEYKGIFYIINLKVIQAMQTRIEELIPLLKYKIDLNVVQDGGVEPLFENVEEVTSNVEEESSVIIGVDMASGETSDHSTGEVEK